MEIERLPHVNELTNLKYSLFLKRRFWPIFVATFLGSFNDNLLRSGLVVLIAYSASKGITLPTRPEILVTICSGLLIMPLILFSSVAGQLADKYEKSRLVVYTKIAEVAIMACVCYGFYVQDIMLLMAMLFISGTHTTFYSPIKFSILPDHLSSKELLAANGFMAGAGYLAVLMGLITGGFLVEYQGNIIGYTALILSGAGLIASLFIPPSKIAHAETLVSWNLWRGTKDMVKYATQDKDIFYCILSLSWFLLVGSVFMTQFANYAQSVVHANNEVYILFLTVFSIGIATGSLMCDTLLKGQVSLKLMPYASLGVSVFTYLMVVTTPMPAHEGLMDASVFLATKENWLMLASMMFVALSGGIYIVPLYAMLQEKTPVQYRSRIMSASNLSDAALMTCAALISVLLLYAGASILDLFLIVATLNLLVCFYARKLAD